jgi:hypothetical protein
MAKDNSVPIYQAYTVIKREGQDDWWCNIGAAFSHADGNGLNLILQALPLDGKIVLRPPKDDANDSDNNRDNRDTRSRANAPRQRSDRR